MKVIALWFVSTLTVLAPSAMAADNVVIAQGLGVMPFAVICSDLQTVIGFFQVYATAKSEQQLDQRTNGQSALIRGPAGPIPQPEDYGCTKVSAGTLMHLQQAFPPVVQVTINGKVVVGVTHPRMIRASQ